MNNIALLAALRECITDAGARCMNDDVRGERARRRLDAITDTAQAAIAEAEKPREPDPADWVCPNCGSDRIQFQMWVRNITDEVLDDTGNYAWCDACADDHDDGEFKHPEQRKDFKAEQAQAAT
jgi:hypothetical protein